MRLTIDIERLCKAEAAAHRNGLKEREFEHLVGEAVVAAMCKLLSFRDDNDTVALDSHIEGYIEGETGSTLEEAR